jgi:hypothetical protein
MAEDYEARANVLKSLGIRRRGGDAAADEPAEADAPDADAPDESADESADPGPAVDTTPEPDAPEEPKAVAGLGIKRRARPTEERLAAEDDGGGNGAPAAPAAPGGLGIKLRKPGADHDHDHAQEAAAPTGPKRRLGNDQVAVILANYFRSRPGLILPDRVWDLKRTHGFYTGDGRAERKLFVGFEPALVLYTIPNYPEEIWPTFTKDYQTIDPGLHRQPKFLADGFIVDEPYNTLGESYMYVVFRADGQPLDLDATAEPEEPTKPKATGLGIKRRK